MVEWIDTSKKDAEVNALPGLKAGVWKIVELIPDLRRKALVWVSFDSGFREGELMNCRIKDIEKGEDGVYFIKCRHSKTVPRTVSLPYSSELLGRWLEKHPKKNDPNAQLWNTSRVMFYNTVKLYGKKALDQNVTVHQLRHTSASHWGPLLDRVSFCKRFGWSYSSKSPDRYLDFAKVSQKKVTQLAKADESQKMKQELEELRIKNQTMQEQMARIVKQMSSMEEIQKSITIKESK